MTHPASIPVIAAVGETIDRPADLAIAREPIRLMADAARVADAEASNTLLARVDSVDVVNQVSWPYTAPQESLCALLGIAPARRHYGKVGGETPIAFLQQAAMRIRDGHSQIALICGGESHQSVARVAREGLALGWTPRSEAPAASVRSQDLAHPLSRQHGVDIPVTVYPLYENAQSHAWGQSPRQALEETGALWAGLSRVAAKNPFAALPRAIPANEIVDTSEANRMIAWPYNKLMIANIAVNQGAAIIVTSLEIARAAGLDDGRLIFFNYGNVAAEPVDYLQRDGFERVAARDMVLQEALRCAGEFSAVELYSCFPCVPKAARRTLNVPDDSPVTVTGGLTFFGAPLNNYMSHATCAMVRVLRMNTGSGMLYGQGGFATKHRTLVLQSGSPGNDPKFLENDLQAEADALRVTPPPVRGEAGEQAKIETFTVIHGRDGRRHGVVVVRPAQGGRTIAAVDDDDTIDLLEADDAYPIGVNGRLYRSSDNKLGWRP